LKGEGAAIAKRAASPIWRRAESNGLWDASRASCVAARGRAMAGEVHAARLWLLSFAVVRVVGNAALGAARRAVEPLNRPPPIV
jgi:hypothetical protein